METIYEVIEEISALIRDRVTPSEFPKYNKFMKSLKEKISSYEAEILSQNEKINKLNLTIEDKDKKLDWANSQLDSQVDEIKRKERLLKGISHLMIDQTKDV